MKISIRYYALHDEQGKYLGCLEVTQDITELQQLTGQKRLLDEVKKKVTKTSFVFVALLYALFSLIYGRNKDQR